MKKHESETPRQPDHILHVEKLTVVLNNKTILSNIDLELRTNEIISIIGPNGGGKSTLLKALVGLLPPTSGTINTKDMLRIGYVPQQFSLPSSLPLRVCDFMALSSHTKSADPTLVSQFKLEQLLTTQMSLLSGGERQRVLLANALLNKPHVVMLDEPMQGLDPDSQAELYGLIRQLPTLYGCAVIIVSHDLHWVMQGTNHVICINQHICCEGVPTDIQTESAFQHLYRTQYVPDTACQNKHHSHLHIDHAGEAFYAHHHHCEHEHDCDA